MKKPVVAAVLTSIDLQGIHSDKQQSWCLLSIQLIRIFIAINKLVLVIIHLVMNCYLLSVNCKKKKKKSVNQSKKKIKNKKINYRKKLFFNRLSSFFWALLLVGYHQTSIFTAATSDIFCCPLLAVRDQAFLRLAVRDLKISRLAVRDLLPKKWHFSLRL